MTSEKRRFLATIDCLQVASSSQSPRTGSIRDGLAAPASRWDADGRAPAAAPPAVIVAPPSPALERSLDHAEPPTARQIRLDLVRDRETRREDSRPRCTRTRSRRRRPHLGRMEGGR